MLCGRKGLHSIRHFCFAGLYPQQNCWFLVRHKAARKALETTLPGPKKVTWAPRTDDWAIKRTMAEILSFKIPWEASSKSKYFGRRKECKPCLWGSVKECTLIASSWKAGLATMHIKGDSTQRASTACGESFPHHHAQSGTWEGNRAPPSCCTGHEIKCELKGSRNQTWCYWCWKGESKALLCVRMHSKCKTSVSIIIARPFFFFFFLPECSEDGMGWETCPPLTVKRG